MCYGAVAFNVLRAYTEYWFANRERQQIVGTDKLTIFRFRNYLIHVTILKCICNILGKITGINELHCTKKITTEFYLDLKAIQAVN